MGLAHVVVDQQVGARIGQNDAARLQDVAAVGHLQRLMGVLFDQQYRYAFLADGADNVKNLADDQRSQTQCRLIEQQKLGFGERKRVGSGKGVSVRVESGGSGSI